MKDLGGRPRTVLRLSATVVVWLSAALFFGCGRPEPRGVILISLDTLRADRLGCYGRAGDPTPALDRLAARGTVFEEAYVQLPGTLPSHMSMFTGLYPQEHGVMPPDGTLPETVPTLPEVLRAAGFRTGGFTEGGYVSGHHGFARGFEQFDDASAHIPSDVERTFARGLRFLQSVDADERFFLFLHTYAVHDPYFPPPAYLGRAFAVETAGFESFEDPEGLLLEQMPEEPTSRHREELRTTRKMIAELAPPGAAEPTGPNLVAVNRSDQSIDEEVRDFYLKLYDAEVRYLDDVVGAFLGGLERLGLVDQVLVIVTSDHGEEFLEHGNLVHEQVYRECIHVPLIYAGPGVGRGRRVRELVESVDLAPTIYDGCGLDDVPRASGVSRREMLTTGGEAPGGQAYSEAAVAPQRTLVRPHDGRVHQLVHLDLPDDGGGHWVSRSIHLRVPARRVGFRAASFHRPRKLTVMVGGAVVEELELGLDWRQVELDLPPDQSLHDVVLRTDDCDSPAEVGVNADTRCLSFRISGLTTQRVELYDTAVDPLEQHDIAGERPRVLADLLTGLLARTFSPVAQQEKVPLDEAAVERLKALGYLE